MRTVSPVEMDDPLVNPDCGWGLWAGPISQRGRRYSVEENTTGFGDDAPLFSFVCIDWYWRLLEPTEGQFYWDDLDQVVSYWVQRGKQINMRLWTTYDPGWAGKGGAQVAPGWLFDKAGCRCFSVPIPLSGEPVGTIRAPDYSDPIYLCRVRKFLTVARDHYEPHSNDSFITWHVGSYGPWGEWWVGHGEYEWPNDEAEHETVVKMQGIYKDLFGTKCQMCCRGDTSGHEGGRDYGTSPDYETWKYKVGIDEAAANGWALGVHGCAWGVNPRQDDYHSRHSRVLLDEHWPANVHYGETNWSYADLAQGHHGGLDKALDGAIALHYNWVHQYMNCRDYQENPNSAYFERGLGAGGLGYRFVLTEAWHPQRLAPGSAFTLKQSWVNRNSGRAWRKYPLAVYLTDPSSGEVSAGPLVDESFDQTMWIAGETYQISSEFTLPLGLDEGTYDLRIAMVDRSRVPRIRMAIQGADGHKRYKIGTVQVVQ